MRETPRTRFAMSFRWRLVLTAGVAVIGLSVLSVLHAQSPSAPTTGSVTFTKDIAPILQAKCQSCHRPDSIAPMSLISYTDVRPWARSIKNRFPYLDPLNHLQVELLRRHRAGESDERARRGIHLSINGIAAGLRNTG